MLIIDSFLTTINVILFVGLIGIPLHVFNMKSETYMAGVKRGFFAACAFIIYCGFLYILRIMIGLPGWLRWFGF